MSPGAISILLLNEYVWREGFLTMSSQAFNLGQGWLLSLRSRHMAITPYSQPPCASGR